MKNFKIILKQFKKKWGKRKGEQLAKDYYKKKKWGNE